MGIKRKWEASNKSVWGINNLEIFKRGRKIADKYTLRAQSNGMRFLKFKSKAVLRISSNKIDAKKAAFDFIRFLIDGFE